MAKQIKVNGKDVTLQSESASYEDIASLGGYDPKRIVSITYQGKPAGDARREGMLAPGQFVRVDDGMRFNVADTSRA